MLKRIMLRAVIYTEYDKIAAARREEVRANLIR